MPTEKPETLKVHAQGDARYFAELIAAEMGWSDLDPLHRLFLRIAAKWIDQATQQEIAPFVAVVKAARQVYRMKGHDHWDPHGTSGSNCAVCILQREVYQPLADALAHHAVQAQLTEKGGDRAQRGTE